MKWCGTPCKNANARRVEGQKRAALAVQLATAQATIRSLEIKREIRQKGDPPHERMEEKARETGGTALP